MQSRRDMPGSTSSTSQSSTPRLLLQRINRSLPRPWRIVAGIALPATLAVTTLLPPNPAGAKAPRAVAPAFALSTTLGAFAGDIGMSEADLAELAAEEFDGATNWGAPTAASREVRVAVNRANIRRGPATTFASLGKLDTSMRVQLLSRDGSWYKVRTQRGTVGWMADEVLVVTAQAAAGLPTEKVVKPSAPSSMATTIESAINVRSGPGTGYKRLGTLKKGVNVDLLAREGAWYKVQAAGGLTGWVAAKYLRLPVDADLVPKDVQAPNVTTELVGFTTADGVKLRNGPGTSYPTLLKFKENTRLTLTARHGEWYKVKTAKGANGWVSAELLSINPDVARRVPVTNDIPATPRPAPAPAPKPAPAAPAQGSAIGSKASRIALGKVGSRYVWGAAGPRAFDCSGLLVYTYRQLGIYLPHKASRQFSSRYGTIIKSMGALQPGDMVFFRNTAGRGITHAALYVGKGKMVSANSRRTGVQYQSINTRYWRSHWAGAVRPYRR